MKHILKSFFIPVVVAIIFGFICGRYVYKTYKDNLYGDLTSSKLYLVEYGKYDTYEDMREENNQNNYVYYQDDEGYKTVVGITKKYDNIEKIKSLYSNNLDVSVYYVPREYINEMQEEYDNELLNTIELNSVKEVVNNILNLYHNDDSIRLISIN